MNTNTGLALIDYWLDLVLYGLIAVGLICFTASVLYKIVRGMWTDS